MPDPKAGPVVDMFKNPNYEQEVDPDEDHEDRVAEQKQQDEKELLELLREWKASNAQD